MLGILAIIPFVILGTAIFITETSYQHVLERELNEIGVVSTIQKEKIVSDFNYLFNAVEAHPNLTDGKTLYSLDKVEEKNGGIPESEETSKREAAKFLISNFGFQSFGITLNDGRMYLLEPYEHQENLSKTNFSDREWFQGVLSSKETYVSDVFISDASKHPIIVISTPIFSNEGEVIGMWGGSLDIEYLSGFFEGTKKKNLSVILLDEKNTIIADTRNFDHNEAISDEMIENIVVNQTSKSPHIKENNNYVFISNIEVGKKQWKLVNIISEKDLIPQFLGQRNSNYVLIVLMGIFITVSEYLLFNFLKRNFQLNLDIKENQKDLVKQERLAVIGEVASRVSHDIRNPLSNIRMALKLIESNPDVKISNEQIADKLQIAKKNIDRIDHQINYVLEYVKTKRLVREKLSLSSCIDEAVKMAHVPDNIKIKIEKTNLIVIVDPIQIQVVFNNILINAIQAMEGREGQIIIRFSEDKEFIIIEIENSGPPISEEVFPHIFEALITTKEIGTGLGLVSCKRIIENHGGVINVKNNPTTFTIKIPKS